MKPISFICTRFIPKPAAEICSEILDTNRWEEFKGYGMLPGIKNATFEIKTNNIIGSRIKVTNTDGSTHTEEIYKWIPGKEIGMKIFQFSAPLNKISSHFTEEWNFETVDTGTFTSRTFHLFPQNNLSYIALWFISFFFKRAISKHLDEMSANSLP